MKFLYLILILTVMTFSLKLVPQWNFKTNGWVNGLVFSHDGKLGIAASSSCAYVVKEGSVISRMCTGTNIMDVSYCCNTFGFIDNEGKVLLFNNEWRTLKLSDDFNGGILLLPSAFVAAGNYLQLTLYNGTSLWRLKVGLVRHGLAVIGNRLYSADIGLRRLLVVDVTRGNIIKMLNYPSFKQEGIYDVKSCDRYLAVTTSSRVYLFEVTPNGSLAKLWVKPGFKFAFTISFSSDCKYLAVVDQNDFSISILNSSGSIVYKLNVRNLPTAISWSMTSIAVGFLDGSVKTFEVVSYRPFGLSIKSLMSLDDYQYEIFKWCYDLVGSPEECYSIAKESKLILPQGIQPLLPRALELISREYRHVNPIALRTSLSLLSGLAR
ncbi:hypothetical protein IPA_06220 [Ignicoccus pacificus DSM 13166]|uniref:Uncharacterized protein n=1 Tax=Ignicoccus pacificus DSM 13166 TaxID=940294 RepID=A0A977PLP8_9CREN|nr:hypothetical protein IPA_06220 [Ignicoccus pacificus DSM 13166]